MPTDTRTSARSLVISFGQPRNQPDGGTSRTWERLIAGKRYAFTAVLMPDGERRYTARYLPAGRLPVQQLWRTVGFWTFPA
jgi:hypothetical protein